MAKNNKISVKEFADLHNTDRQTILRHIRNGWLKAEKKIELSSKAGFIYVIDKKEKFTPRKPGPIKPLQKQKKEK
ncbi:MAG: hypothetical protein WC358_08330 [Ignavibacteria bacterium]|jgi:hypothetical protein